MSVINNALTDLANKDGAKAAVLQKAEIPKVKKTGRLAWAIGGFTFSLAVGGWAVSYQGESEVAPLPPAEASISVSVPEKPVIIKEPLKTETADSPTSQLVTSGDSIQVYDAKPVSGVNPVISGEQEAKEAPVKSAPKKVKSVAVVKKSPPPVNKKSTTLTKRKEKTGKPVLIAQAVSKQSNDDNSPGSLDVQQVELTPDQIAEKAIERAKHALDANDLNTAIREYETALKYRAKDDASRKKLAALYYGKKNLRKSVDVLRRGIRLEESNQTLRIALSKLLIREGQPEAALSPLVYMPEEPQLEYLSLRAGIAQQIKNSEIALETYQLLVDREGDNARWWLGLAIQQERELMHQEAMHSYTQALGRIGVSKQTQAFIRDRLDLLRSLEADSTEETENAD